MAFQHRSLLLTDEKQWDRDYSGLRFSDFTAVSSAFHRCNFDRIRMAQTCFGGGVSDSKYIDCTFNEARFTAIAPGFAKFVRCSFKDVRIKSFFSRGIELIDCTVSGEIVGGYFNGALPPDMPPRLGRPRNRFEGNDFSHAKLIDVGFRTGIDLTKQIMPVGPDYVLIHDAAARLAAARRDLAISANADERRGVEGVFRFLENELQDGQEQLFLNISSLPKKLIPAIVRVLTAMGWVSGTVRAS